jgi:hypothetical protein
MLAYPLSGVGHLEKGTEHKKGESQIGNFQLEARI